MRAQYKINFDRPPRLKKLPEVLIISPELRHLYIQTYIQTDQPRSQALCVVLWLAWPLRGPRGSI